MKELNEAKVLAVGPGGLDKEGKRVKCSVAPGDKVLIPQVCFEGSFCWFGDGVVCFVVDYKGIIPEGIGLVILG